MSIDSRLLKFTHWVGNTSEFLRVPGACQYHLLGKLPFLLVPLEGKCYPLHPQEKHRQGFSRGCGWGQKGGLAPSWVEKMRFTLLFESSPISEARTRSQALLSFNLSERLLTGPPHLLASGPCR